VVAVLIGLFVVLLIMGMPVVFAMGVSASIHIIFFSSHPIEVIAHRISFGIYSWPLLAVPFFIFAGMLMNRGGVTRRIFNFVNSVVGHITGGLGHVNVIASIIFAGISGSATADCGGLGQIEMEAMIDAGYDRDFSAAITASSSCIGPIFPPSISLILYGVIAEQSIIQLFAGGVFPGLLMGAALMIVIYFLAKTKIVRCPVQPRVPFSTIWKLFKAALPPLLAPGIILGGILSGVITPTEAGIIACVYALMLGVIYGEITLKNLPSIMKEAAQTIAMPMFIIAVSALFSWVVILEQIPQMFARWMMSFTQNPTVILFGLSAIMFVAGCFMEPTVILLIFAPVFIPLAKLVGIDLIHLGVIMALNMTLAMMTPPVGMGLYILSDLAKTPIERVFKASLPFIGALVASLVFVILIPKSVLLLANLF
jgi:tripartite ATP-independent transporter DctM subunit